MLANNSFPYITADSFIIQSLSDTVVLTGHDQLPQKYIMEEEEQQYMQQWYMNMSSAIHLRFNKNNNSRIKTNSIRREEKSPHRPHRRGYFAAACFIHTEFSHLEPKVNGLTYQSAFRQFYNDELHVTSIMEKEHKSRQGGENVYENMDTCGVMCNPSCPPIS